MFKYTKSDMAGEHSYKKQKINITKKTIKKKKCVGGLVLKKTVLSFFFRLAGRQMEQALRQVGGRQKINKI